MLQPRPCLNVRCWVTLSMPSTSSGVGIGCSFPGRFGLVDLAPATDVADVLESIRVMPNCTLQLGASQPHIRRGACFFLSLNSVETGSFA